jgi:hypothetical protein
MATETAVIQFLIALIAPFMAAYCLGYFVRRSIKYIAGLFGFFFFVVGVMWYGGILPSLTPVQNWVTDVAETGYNKSQELSNRIGDTVDEKKDGSNSQMNIIIDVSSFFTGFIFGLTSGNRRDRGIRLVSD